VSSVRPVPETELMGGEELSADNAWRTVRRYHLGRHSAAAFLRFRYGDGFSHARAFALPSGRPLSRFTGGVTRPKPCGMCCDGRWGSARCSPR
jgi:hypothetical protein